MKLANYRQTLKKPLRQATLCFLKKDSQILLAMKKRGFGAGRWNGVGGKPKPDETIEQTAVRETLEEIGVNLKNFKKVANLHFYFPTLPLNKNWNQQVIVYLAESWEGKPSESEEMTPQWFDLTQIPFDKMWEDDKFWLPKVLTGKFIEAHFAFDKNQKLTEFELTEKNLS